MVSAGSVVWLVRNTKCLAGFGVLETDAPQMSGIILFGIEAIQGDGLVADHAAGSVRWVRNRPDGRPDSTWRE